MQVQINITTGKPDNGKNAIALNMTSYASNEWATYKQWESAGYQVQKGSKGESIQVVCAML